SRGPAHRRARCVRTGRNPEGRTPSIDPSPHSPTSGGRLLEPRFFFRRLLTVLVVALAGLLTPMAAKAQLGAAPQPTAHKAGGEANLVLPDLSSQKFMGIDGHTLLTVGLVVCALGLIFGISIFNQLKNMPVHKSMLDVSELIYATCKAYLVQQGKF